MTIFSPAQLSALAATIPPDLPVGHRNALVGGVDSTGAQVVLVFSRPLGVGTFQAQGAIRHDWSGDDSVGAKFMYSW